MRTVLSRKVDLEPSPLLRAGLLLIATVSAVGLCVILKDILLLAFLGLILSIWLSFPIAFLSKWMPRGIAVFATLFLLLIGISGLGSMVFPKLANQSKSVLEKLPKAVNRVEGWLSQVTEKVPVAQLQQSEKVKEHLGDRFEKWTETGIGALVPAAKGILTGAAGAVFVFVLAAFLAYQPKIYHQGLRQLVPKNRENIFDEAYLRLANGCKRWMLGILCSMTIMGTFTLIGLTVAGIENAFFLAILTFLGTFVPYVGAIASAFPGLLIGLSQSFSHFLFACLVYLGVHIVEGYLVQPLIMKRVVDVPPAVLLIGQAIVGTLFGLLGVIVAAPILVFLNILIQYLYVEQFLNKAPHPER